VVLTLHQDACSRVGSMGHRPLHSLLTWRIISTHARASADLLGPPSEREQQVTDKILSHNKCYGTSHSRADYRVNVGYVPTMAMHLPGLLRHFWNVPFSMGTRQKHCTLVVGQ
jgi:hypothetical protein